MSDFLQDLRHALRGAAKSPGFTCGAVLALALGIGANTAIFGLANAAFFRSLPYPHAERLAFLWQNNSRTGEMEGLVSYPNLADWRAQNRSFEGMAFFNSSVDLLIGDGHERVLGSSVEVNFFSVMGVNPILGRTFAPDEQLHSSSDGAMVGDVVVIGSALWRSRYASDPHVVGQSLPFDGGNATIIGVMPEGFSFPDGAELWIPRYMNEFSKTKARQYPNLMVIGRLRDGISWAEAGAELDMTTERLSEQYPTIDGGVGVRIVPLRKQLSRNAGQGILVLWGAILGLLLIACLNSSNLILARAAGRSKEIAIRYSLGATRIRITKQFLAESLVLVGGGTAAGVALAFWIVALVAKLNPDIAKLRADLIDVRVLGYTIGVATFATVVCGVLPSILSSQLDLTRSLKEIAASAPSSPQWLRKILIVAEVSLAFVLLVGSGLLVRSLWQVFAQEPGFDAAQILTFHLVWPGLTMSPDQAKRNAEFSDLLTRLRVLPGVASAGATSKVLFPSEMYKVPFVIEGQQPDTSNSRPFLAHGDATPSFFETMRIPLLRGRVFRQADTTETAPPVVIVNAAATQFYWPNDDPIGKRLRFDDPNFKSPWFTVVGVVGDVRQQGLEHQPGPMAYIPSPGYFADDVVVRTKGDPRALAASLHAEVQGVDKSVVVENMQPVSEMLAVRESGRRFNAILLGAFAFTALLLAAVGIYGNLSYWVRQGTREIGVRRALGAQERDILSLVIRRGITLTVTGLAFGIIGAAVSSRLITSLLFGVSPTDPATFAAISILMVTVALLACCIPARRATKIDPLDALRYE